MAEQSLWERVVALTISAGAFGSTELSEVAGVVAARTAMTCGVSPSWT